MTERISIIVITYRRAPWVRRCLDHLAAQTESADQIIVVDASEDSATADVVLDYEGVIYARNPGGVGNATSSRNVGFKLADGDIIAFLDDDAYAEASYVETLRRVYDDPTIGLGCSRTLNGQPGESGIVPDGVGRLLADGRLIGNFASDLGAGSIVEIDHGIGATMSFRRATLDAMGGFREDYRGVSALRDDTDAFLRARRLGFRAVFVNDAVAHHVAAPQAKGMRFDLRYEYATARNHALLLINNFGVLDRRVRRSITGNILGTLKDRRRPLMRRCLRASVAAAGCLHGVTITVRRQGGRPLPARVSEGVFSDQRVA